MAHAAYLYCVVHSAGKPAATRVPSGVPGATKPAVIEVGGSQWLVVSQVPLETYGPQPLESALRDLEWVARVAVAHEAVVEHFARRRALTVVPMKVLTLFSSVDRAAQEMRTRRREIATVVKRLSGCQEWGVRVTRGAPRRAARPQPVSARSGVAFLTARKQAIDDARNAAARAIGAADRTFEQLALLAREVRRRDIVPEGAVPPLLDAAFLVPLAVRAKFQAAARSSAKVCAEAGVDLTLTGPWPPYNFVQAGDAA